MKKMNNTVLVETEKVYEKKKISQKKSVHIFFMNFNNILKPISNI